MNFKNLISRFVKPFLVLILGLHLCMPMNAEAGLGKKILIGSAIVKAVRVLKSKNVAKAAKKSTKPVKPIDQAQGVKTVTVSKSRYPESAKHIEEAQAAGKPQNLTLDRAGAAQRRREALKDTPASRGMDRDEYPPALVKEGGTGSSVRKITPKDNRGSGSCVGHQCRGLPDGETIQIKVVP